MQDYLRIARRAAREGNARFSQLEYILDAANNQAPTQKLDAVELCLTTLQHQVCHWYNAAALNNDTLAKYNDVVKAIAYARMLDNGPKRRQEIVAAFNQLVELLPALKESKDKYDDMKYQYKERRAFIDKLNETRDYRSAPIKMNDHV